METERNVHLRERDVGNWGQPAGVLFLSLSLSLSLSLLVGTICQNLIELL